MLHARSNFRSNDFLCGVGRKFSGRVCEEKVLLFISNYI